MINVKTTTECTFQLLTNRTTAGKRNLWPVLVGVVLNKTGQPIISRRVIDLRRILIKSEIHLSARRVHYVKHNVAHTIHIVR